MKNSLKDFVSSIYNPQFYKNIPNKSFKDIFKYILNISLFFSILLAIFIIIYTVISLEVFNIAVVVSLFFAGLSVFITYFLTIFIIWILHGWIYGIFLFIFLYVFRRKNSYVNSVKVSMYAVSWIGIINILINKLFLSYTLVSILGILAPFLILFINLRKK